MRTSPQKAHPALYLYSSRNISNRSYDFTRRAGSNWEVRSRENGGWYHINSLWCKDRCNSGRYSSTFDNFWRYPLLDFPTKYWYLCENGLKVMGETENCSTAKYYKVSNIVLILLHKQLSLGVGLSAITIWAFSVKLDLVFSNKQYCSAQQKLKKTFLTANHQSRFDFLCMFPNFTIQF